MRISLLVLALSLAACSGPPVAQPGSVEATTATVPAGPDALACVLSLAARAGYAPVAAETGVFVRVERRESIRGYTQPLIDVATATLARGALTLHGTTSVPTSEGGRRPTRTSQTVADHVSAWAESCAG